MSLFKTKWFILKITFNEKDIFYDIFTKEYGRLFLKSKKDKLKKNLEIWNIIDFEIEIKKENMINYLKNIKLINNFDYKDKDFELIETYLKLINLLYKNTPKNIVINEIFDLLFILNKNENINVEKILFISIKINYIFWKINLDNIDNIDLKKIIHFISSNKAEDIIKLKWLKQETKNIIIKNYLC